MAVKIRLARHGAKKRPYYRVVVADSRAPRDGRIIEEVGRYNPMTSSLLVDAVSKEEGVDPDMSHKLGALLRNYLRPNAGYCLLLDSHPLKDFLTTVSELARSEFSEVPSWMNCWSCRTVSLAQCSSLPLRSRSWYCSLTQTVLSWVSITISSWVATLELESANRFFGTESGQRSSLFDLFLQFDTTSWMTSCPFPGDNADRFYITPGKGHTLSWVLKRRGHYHALLIQLKLRRTSVGAQRALWTTGQAPSRLMVPASNRRTHNRRRKRRFIRPGFLIFGTAVLIAAVLIVSGHTPSAAWLGFRTY